MKKLVSLISLFCFVLSISAQTIEIQLKYADMKWLDHNLTGAITDYRAIIKSGSLPSEYKPLIYLRLAEAQFQSGKYAECKKTLYQLSSVSPLREHYRLKKEELEKALDGGARQSTYNPFPENPEKAASIYVSQDYTGVSDGSVIAPFVSIEDAVKYSSEIVSSPGTVKGIVEIILLDEVYKTEGSVTLDKSLSGTRENPVVIRSASPSGRTMISGGVRIKKWNVETDPAVLALLPHMAVGKVMVADLKENGVANINELVFGGWGSRRGFNTKPVPQLFYKDSIMNYSRWPDKDFTVFPLTLFRDERAEKWAGEQDVWIHGYFGNLWSDIYEKLEDYKDSIILTRPYNDNVKEAGKWYALNLLSEMDQEGECKISPEEGKIWFFPPEDFNPDECILSVYGKAFQMDSCNFLTFRDIDFRYLRGDAFIASHCSYLSFVNCNFRDISGYAMLINGGNNHFIHSCSFEGMGRGGIQLNSGNMERLESSGCIVENCVFRNLSLIDRTYTPGIWLYGCGTLVQHCLFENIPSSGMRIEGVNMLVQLNEFSRCVTESDDQGALESHGNVLFRGNTVRWNYFHDIGCEPQQMAAGVRLDDAISGFNIIENIFVRSQKGIFGAVQIHGGKDNIIEGNYFFECNAAISQSAWGDLRWRTMLSREHLKNEYWKSNLWQSTFPELKNIYENADKNYYTDNILINGKTLFLRKASVTEVFNNSIFTDPDLTITGESFKKYITPWHAIPVEDTGTY